MRLKALAPVVPLAPHPTKKSETVAARAKGPTSPGRGSSLLWGGTLDRIGTRHARPVIVCPARHRIECSTPRAQQVRGNAGEGAS